MRMTWSTVLTKILPSPTAPVFAACCTASRVASSRPSSTTTSSFSLGRKSTTYSAPRYNSVCPFWRPKPRTSLTVMPLTPAAVRASRTSSSLYGRMMQLISFMHVSRGWRRDGDSPRAAGAGSERFAQGQHAGGTTDEMAVGVGVGGAFGIGVVVTERNRIAMAEGPGHTKFPVRVGSARRVRDVLVTRMRVEGPAGAELDIPGQVEVAAVPAVGEAEQVGERVRILQRQRLVRQRDIAFGGVRPGEAGGIVAGVVVLVQPDVVTPVAAEAAAIAAVEIDLDAAGKRRRRDRGIRQPADVAAPCADVPATGMVVLDARLHRRLLIGLGKTAEQVVVDHRHAAAGTAGGFRRRRGPASQHGQHGQHGHTGTHSPHRPSLHRSAPSFHGGAGSIDAFPCAWHQAPEQRRDALLCLVHSKCRAGGEKAVLPHRSNNAGEGFEGDLPQAGDVQAPSRCNGARYSVPPLLAPVRATSRGICAAPRFAAARANRLVKSHVNCAASRSRRPGQSRSSIRNHPVTDLLHVILLGIIEGITEFLPISSTGHLLIAEKFGLGARSDLFNIGIQAGAILAVTLIYWKRIWQLLTQWRVPANRDYLLKLVVAFLITAVLGFIAVKLGFTLPETVTPVAWALVIGGVWMIAAERLAARQPDRTEVTWKVAIL